MFHHSKKIKLMFVILALISLFVLILIGLLLFKLSHTPTDTSIQIQNQTIDENFVLPESKTSEELAHEQEIMKQEYINAVLVLYAQTKSSSDAIDMVLSQAEDGLLALRVPKDLQEAHLDAVLSIARLRVRVESMASSDGVKEEVLSLLSGLIGK